MRFSDETSCCWEKNCQLKAVDREIEDTERDIKGLRELNISDFPYERKTTLVESKM